MPGSVRTDFDPLWDADIVSIVWLSVEVKRGSLSVCVHRKRRVLI
jgi:hypothetical protein